MLKTYLVRGLLNGRAVRAEAFADNADSAKRKAQRQGVTVTSIELLDDGSSVSFDTPVVGESNYQDAIEEIAGGYSESGANLETLASLVLEDSNPYDSNAVRVDIDGKKVGYLSRANAIAYRRLQQAEQRPDPTRYVRAMVRGGWVGRDGEEDGPFGVTLDIQL